MMPGENLDLSSDVPNQRRGSAPDKRRYLGIHFACCDVYSRLYINPHGTCYVGNCPRCARRLEILVGPGGTESRFFTVY